MEYLLLGVMAGTIAGILPGVGIFATLLLLYPWLLTLPIIDTFVFYLALTSTTQYIGSVSATILAVPGESSSLPAIYEGNTLYKKGLGGIAISGAAIGSVVGALLTLGLITLVSPYLTYIYYFFNTYIQAFVLWGVLLIMLFFSNKNIFISAVLACAGLWLGYIGCEYIAGFGFCHMPITWEPIRADLTTGLPMLSVIGALFVFPQLLKFSKPTLTHVAQQKNTLLEHFKYYWDNIDSSLRGTTLGFFLGFTPGGSTTISSNTAHRMEVLREKKLGRYKQGNYRCLVSAETANNAAAFTTLLPLFILGIPFGASEALFYDIMMVKGFYFSDNFDMAFFLETIAYNLVIINVIAFFIAWPFAKYIAYIMMVPQKVLNIGVFLILCGVMWHVGSAMFQSEYYLFTFFALLPFGYLLRNYDTMPLVFAFILQDGFFMNAVTIKDLVISYF